MVKMFGSEMCPDCVACKMNFDQYGISYDYMDINVSLKNLKEFLILRDKETCFLPLKEIHDIGLPTLVLEDGKVLVDWEGFVREQGFEVLEIASKNACSLDHKGC